MGNVGSGDEEFLIDVFCQRLFEVEEGPTSQTLNGLKANISYILLETDGFISCLEAGPFILGNHSGSLVLFFRCGSSKCRQFH